MAVRIVTDTTHYMPRELVEGYGLELVSLYVNYDGRTERESDMADFDTYYEYLVSAEDLPTTSQPSVGDFLAAYEPIIEAGDDIVSVHISGGLSGTVHSAEQARDELVGRGVERSRIQVVDSSSAAGGLGAITIAVANAAADGRDAADAAQAARSAGAALKMFFAVDTLEYLRKGGRIGAAQALLGSTLKIKPILTLGEEITPIDRVRTASRAFDRMVHYLRERHEEGCDRFIIQHVRDPERAEKLVEAGREIYGNEPLFCTEIGPVIGTHVGPGLLGVAGVPARVLGG